MSIVMEPIGTVHGGRDVPEDDDWGQSRARIDLDPVRFDTEAGDDQIVTGARHPRGNTDWPKVGIFAQRGKNRPNRIGVTVCDIVAVNGLSLEVRGLDAIDGTPVLDLKPVMAGFAPRGPHREPDWAREIMKDYW
jgi:tRNA (Thr-GGU) A37 N-methylase